MLFFLKSDSGYFLFKILISVKCTLVSEPDEDQTELYAAFSFIYVVMFQAEKKSRGFMTQMQIFKRRLSVEIKLNA